MDNIETMLAECKSDSVHPDRDVLIRNYMPFIIECVNKATGRFVDLNNSDELTIGMQAFDEAISRYEKERGSFVNFASLLIRSRVIDHLRKDKKDDSLYVDARDIEESAECDVDLEVKYEICVFKDYLRRFGIEMETLVDDAPRHDSVRVELIGLGKKLAHDGSFIKRMYETRKLPMSMITTGYGITKRRLKRHRDFIIAVVIIYSKKLTYIQEYLDGGE